MCSCYEPTSHLLAHVNGPFFFLFLRNPVRLQEAASAKMLGPFLIGRRPPFIPVRSLSYLGHCSSFVLSFLFFLGGGWGGGAWTRQHNETMPVRRPRPESRGGNRAEWTAQCFWGSAHNGAPARADEATCLRRSPFGQLPPHLAGPVSPVGPRLQAFFLFFWGGGSRRSGEEGGGRHAAEIGKSREEPRRRGQTPHAHANMFDI